MTFHFSLLSCSPVMSFFLLILLLASTTLTNPSRPLSTFSVALLLARSNWAYIFTNDVAVAKLVRRILPTLFVYIVADGTQSALTGVLKGLGLQRVGGPIVLFSYYVIGLPISAILAFKFKIGVVGLCVGTTVGTWVSFLNVACAFQSTSRCMNQISKHCIVTNVRDS